MPIIINGPFSGKPIKVREQDIGRALRDEENRIFYALPRPDGDGYYAAPTRAGGPKDLERYDKLVGKGIAGAKHSHEVQVEQLHDATGRRRSSSRGKLVILVLFIIVAAIAYYFWFHLKNQWFKGPTGGNIPMGVVMPPQALLAPSPQARSWSYSTLAGMPHTTPLFRL